MVPHSIPKQTFFNLLNALQTISPMLEAVPRRIIPPP
jgi:hypothetical protein